MSESTCNCGKPTRDDRYVCDDCLDALSRALGEVPALEAELETTITKRKGVDYRRVGGGKGAKTAPRGDKRIPGDMSEHATTMDSPALGAHIQGDPMDMTAAEAREHLRAILVLWVRFCLEERVRNSSPHQGIPADTLPAISRWLLWRVDGLALLDIGAEAVEEITSAVAHCHRLIDRPADRQYLGECECGEGRLYARPGGAMARCNVCGTNIDAESLRVSLLRELDDRLCTAAEVAELSTYLGLPDDRERVRKRIERWGASDRHVLARVKVNGQDHYRFGAAYLALMEHENRREAKSA